MQIDDMLWIAPNDLPLADLFGIPHSIFTPWCAHVRSGALFSEINYVHSRFKASRAPSSSSSTTPLRSSSCLPRLNLRQRSWGR